MLCKYPTSDYSVKNNNSTINNLSGFDAYPIRGLCNFLITFLTYLTKAFYRNHKILSVQNENWFENESQT